MDRHWIDTSPEHTGFHLIGLSSAIGHSFGLLLQADLTDLTMDGNELAMPYISIQIPSSIIPSLYNTSRLSDRAYYILSS